MQITRRVDFCASHILSSPSLSPEENLARYGPEANPHGHGHNYTLEVTVEGTPDPVTGMIVDLKVLKDLMTSEVVDSFDHRFLNHEVPPFDTVIPTPENMAIEIWRRLAPHFPGPVARLHCVRLQETDDYFVEYFGS
ncbi:MAG: 6-carboxytetrahydropterin synthase [Acidobacteria bacterium]|nr:6-carboxytetrahydropterin synthase [Acidobacteriota bacterium]